MGIESKEEVITWFKELSGAKRIEVLSGLLNTCIPLEWRFFATLVESLGRRDYQTLLDDEHKANSPQELELVCSAEWLPDPDLQDGVLDTRVAGDRISPKPEVPVSSHLKPPVEVRPSRDLKNSHESSSPTPKDHLFLTNVRKKVVVYLCLLSSSNRVCATIVFEALKKHLNVEQIRTHIEKRGLYQHKNSRDKSPTGSSRDSLKLDTQLVAEVNLLHTLAIYHPAFTFEQQSVLSRQVSLSIRNKNFVLHVSIVHS